MKMRNKNLPKTFTNNYLPEYNRKSGIKDRI